MVPHRLVMPILAFCLSYTRPAFGFAAKAKSSSLVDMRRRALSKVASKHVPTKRKQNGQQQAAIHQHLSKPFLLEVFDEALFRQQSAIEALDREVERKKMEETDNESMTHDVVCNDTNELELESTESESKDGDRDIFSRVEARKIELRDIESRIQNLRFTTEQTNGQLSQKDLERIKQEIMELGYASIFKQPQSSWKSTKARENEFGRPQGFDGDIFYSPLGVPILVGRMNAHKDDVMRNAAQGSDLWFQVEDYNGSRVLLRTSLMRGTEGSKQCRQMAANLASKYSVWGDEYDSIPVMYTDSRKVAKRGSRIGNMKKSKSLGRIMGYPMNI